MTKLERWLWKNCTLKGNGEASNSLYFMYGLLEIRYSDHYATNSTGDLQIIKSSVYESKFYAVTPKGGVKFMLINATQIIEYIKHQAGTKELLTLYTVKPIASNKDVNKIVFPDSLFIPYKTNIKVLNQLLFRKAEQWSNNEIKGLKQAVTYYFRRNHGFTTAITDYLKKHALSFVDVINLYKIVIVDSKIPFSVEIIEKVLQYINKLKHEGTL